MPIGGGPIGGSPIGGSGPVSSSAPATVGFVDLWRMWGWWSGDGTVVAQPGTGGYLFTAFGRNKGHASVGANTGHAGTDHNKAHVRARNQI